MTIGVVDLLPKDVAKNFLGSGLTHILVVSGSNIAFLILLIGFLLRYFPKKNVIHIGITGSILLIYGSLVGWDTSVVRATVMGILSYTIVTGGHRASSGA